MEPVDPKVMAGQLLRPRPTGRMDNSALTAALMRQDAGAQPLYSIFGAANHGLDPVPSLRNTNPMEMAMNFMPMGMVGKAGKVLKSQGVRSRAEELAETLRKAFPKARVEIQNSKTNVGESSYVRIGGMEGKRYMDTQVRVSDHGVGPGRYGDYIDFVDAAKPYDVDALIEKLAPSYERVFGQKK